MGNSKPVNGSKYPSSGPKPLGFPIATKEVIKIEQFLNNRDWCIKGDLTRIIERANREIERIQVEAIRGIVSKLECYESEATLWANNEMTTLEGEPERITKREQAKSRTDVKHIRSAIEKIRRSEL